MEKEIDYQLCGGCGYEFPMSRTNISYQVVHILGECPACKIKLWDCDNKPIDRGFKKLTKVPFIYLDKNDTTHLDIREVLIKERFDKMMEVSKGDIMLAILYSEKLKETMDWGYRQYYWCDDCNEK